MKESGREYGRKEKRGRDTVNTNIQEYAFLQFFLKILNDGDWVTALLSDFHILTPCTLILLALTLRLC